MLERNSGHLVGTLVCGRRCVGPRVARVASTLAANPEGLGDAWSITMTGRPVGPGALRLAFIRAAIVIQSRERRS